MNYEILKNEINKQQYDNLSLAQIVALLNKPTITPKPVNLDAPPADISIAHQLGLNGVRAGHIQRVMGIETMAIKKARRRNRKNERVGN